MSRLLATNYTGTLQFPYATAGTDLFKKEDVQTLALAVDQHDHSAGKGLVIPAASIVMPFLDLTVTRYLYHGSGTNNVIHPASAQANNLNIEATQGMVSASGRTNALLSANAYYDGTNWFQYNTGQPSWQLNMTANAFNLYNSVAGSVTWVSQFSVNSGGGGNFGGGLTVNTNRGANQGAINFFTQAGSASDASIFAEGGSMYLWLTAAGGAYVQRSGGASWATLSCGPLVVSGDANMYNCRINNPGGVYFGTAAAYTFNGTDSFIDTGASGGWYFRRMGGATMFWVTNGGAGNFNGSLTLNNGRGPNQGGISLLNGVGGAANDYTIFSENGNLYIWGLNGIVNQGQGGSGWKPISASAFNVNSALKDKLEVSALADPLNLVLDERLHGVRYLDRLSREQRVGFVGDAWQAVVPEIVRLDDYGEVQAMDYARVGAITFEALKQYVHQTDARLSALEARLAA